MHIRRFQVLALSVASLLPLLAAQPTLADEASKSSDGKSEPSMEKLRGHRIQLREELMVPSLKGIRGLAFGLPGHYPDQNLNQAIENGLKQLPVPTKKMTELEPGVTKPIDALLQVKVLGAGKQHSVVELTVVQWCSLVRDPAVKVRTITYKDQAVTTHPFVKDTVSKMVDQFVIDFMKANKNSSAAEGQKASKS